MKTKRRKKASNPPATWRDTYYLKAYLLAKEGNTDAAVAKLLGASAPTFRRWKRDRKALRVALKKARGGEANRAESFSEYVHGKLPPHLVPLWDALSGADGDNPERRAERLLAGQGKEVRQHLFVHSWVTSNFNKAQACRLANVGPATLRDWAKDPAFAELLDQVQAMKRDFVEGHLMQLIADGDTAATVFAAKTLLRDRGYDSKVTVEHTGNVKHTHDTLNYEDLPLDIKKSILAWAESTGRDTTPAALLPHHDAVDADYEIMEASDGKDE